MKLLPYIDLRTAETERARLATELGYPKAGRDVGSGIHAPPEQTATVWHHAIVEAPDGRAALELPAGDVDATKGLTGSEVAREVDVTPDWIAVPVLKVPEEPVKAPEKPEAPAPDALALDGALDPLKP